MFGRYRVWRERAVALARDREDLVVSQRSLRTEYLERLRTETDLRLPGKAGFAGWLRRRVVVPAAMVSGRVSLDDMGTHAGALTYASVIAIPPLLLFALSIASFVVKGNQEELHHLVDAIAGVFPGQLEQAIDTFLTKQLSTAVNARVTVGIIGIIGLLWTASSLASRFRHALGEIFATKRTGILTGRPAGMIIGVMTIVAIVGLAILSWLQNWVQGRHHGSGVGDAASNVAAVVGEFVFFLALYRLLTPGRGPSLRQHLPGTIVFVVGWVGLQALGGLYFSQIVTKSTALYGTLGALFGVLAFLYATAWLLLLGAEVSAEFWHPVPEVPG